jgi:hypothetical protein
VAENPAVLRRIIEKWKVAWRGEEGRKSEEFLLPVAVDDRTEHDDWVLVSVVSSKKGGLLGDLDPLCVRIFDAAQRPGVAARVARNVEVLIRGVRAHTQPDTSIVEVLPCPVVRVSSQRIVCALGPFSSGV